MKHSKLIAVTVAVIFCLSAIPLFMGEGNDVAADDEIPTESVLELRAGDAWGQSVHLTYKDLEPKIADILRDKGYISDEDTLLGGLAELAEKMLSEMDTDDVGFFDPATIKALVLRLNFDINEALLVEVVKADNRGYTVDLFAGISMNVNIGATIKAKFLKEGSYEIGTPIDAESYELREVYLNLNLFAKLFVSGTLDFAKNGALKAADLAVEAAFSLDINTNLSPSLISPAGTYMPSIQDMLGGDIPIPEALGIKYQNVTLGAGAEIKLSAKMEAGGTGLIIIPTTLEDDTTSKVNSNIAITDFSIFGKVTVTDDLEKVLDEFLGNGFVQSEIYNFTFVIQKKFNAISPALQILKDGELNLSDYVLDLVYEVLNVFKINLKYEVYVEGDCEDGFDISIIMPDGYEWDSVNNEDKPIYITYIIAEFLWEDIETPINFLEMMYDADDPDDKKILDIIETLGLTDSFTFKKLDGNEKSEVKKVVNNIKNAKKGSFGNNDGNMLIFACIGVAAVAAIGVGFLLLRKT